MTADVFWERRSALWFGCSGDGPTELRALESGRPQSPTRSVGPRFAQSGPRPQKGKAGFLQPRPDSDGLPQRSSLDRTADVWIPHEEDSTPKAGISQCWVRSFGRELGITNPFFGAF